MQHWTIKELLKNVTIYYGCARLSERHIILSPKWFTLVFNNIFRILNWKDILIKDKLLNNLKYADDIVPITEDLQNMLI